MSRSTLRLPVMATAAILLGAACCVRASAADPLESGPLWRLPNADDVEARAMAWLAERDSEATLQAKATKLWADTPPQAGDMQVLDCLAATFALADANAAALVDLCSRPKAGATLPDQAWLADPQTPPLVANNMRLFYGRWLAQESLYDESLEQISGLKPEDVVAPACLLFYQGVVHHRLLDDPEEGIKAVEQLLAGAEQSPQRYIDVAYLVQQDLQGLEDDSLDHIARRMDDIRRRLDLGRAGPKVRGIEDGVIEALDKLIKEAEDQQQQGSSPRNSIRSMSPAQDSQIITGRGPGNVIPRGLGDEGGWGDLPPKEREAVLQQIGREFPSHYRDVIEQYFRRLATEGGE